MVERRRMVVYHQAMEEVRDSMACPHDQLLIAILVRRFGKI